MGEMVDSDSSDRTGDELATTRGPSGEVRSSSSKSTDGSVLCVIVGPFAVSMIEYHSPLRIRSMGVL